MTETPPKSTFIATYFDPFNIIILLGLLLLGFIARKVALWLSEKEKQSEWYQENVGNEYKLEFPDHERSQFEHLVDRLKERKMEDLLDQDARIREKLGKKAMTSTAEEKGKDKDSLLKDGQGSEGGGSGGPSGLNLKEQLANIIIEEGGDEEKGKKKFMIENPEFDELFSQTLTDAECAILLNQLKNVMIKSIENLHQLQNDRPGCYKLWRSKLISESYWESLLACHEEVKNDISEVIKEVSKIKPAIANRFLDDCIALWRRQMATQQVEEEKVKKETLKKEDKRKQEIEEKKKEQQKYRDEKEREKLAAQLMAEEEREINSKNKGVKNRKKKGGSK